MNDFDKELLKNGVSKEDIDDFNNWLKHRTITEKLDDFFYIQYSYAFDNILAFYSDSF